MVDIAVRLVTKIDARRLAMWILAVAPHITLDTLADDDEKGRIRVTACIHHTTSLTELVPCGFWSSILLQHIPYTTLKR